jgi:phosphoribosyl 1,2-cyclic phosphate phosphodiesterase
MVGCRCDVCRSTDPRDTRLRPSVYLEVDGGPSILIDTSTDLRQQALRHAITRVDAILYTHSHADHVMGLDEVRRFNALQNHAIPAFADARTANDLRRSFQYVFSEPDQQGGGVPQVTLSTVVGPLIIDDVRVVPVPIYHGRRTILGYRIGEFAYLTDCSGIPEESCPLLDGLDVLVLGALRHRPHPTHFTVAEATAAIARLQPRRAYLTHICHDLPHAATNAALPDHIQLAHDGLTVDVQVGAGGKGGSVRQVGPVGPIPNP